MEITDRILAALGIKSTNDKLTRDFILTYMTDNQTEFDAYVQRVQLAERYYVNENDVLFIDRFKDLNGRRTAVSKNPLRNADNRVSHNWHNLLLNQKDSYLSSVPPKFDVGDSEKNKRINKVLGSRYKKVFSDWIINAGNGGRGWCHYWIDNAGNFKYMSINPKECFPIYSNKGDGDLDGMIRRFPITDEEGKEATCYEIWDAKQVRTYVLRGKKLTPYPQFTIIDFTTKETEKVNFYVHKLGAIPFIKLPNNKEETDDLKNIKGLIDVYDKVYSGYVNDLDDIQQMIFILTNYGGQDKEEFLQDLLYYKVLKIDKDEESDPAGLETLSLDIPVEARTELLRLTKEQIFISGQGVNPTKENMNNNSGLALKFLYSLLDLKCDILEAQFRPALEQLVRAILRHEFPNTDADDVEIKQIWTRSAITDESMWAEVISRVAAVSSDEAIAKYNPIVEDWETEVALRDQQKMDELEMADQYKNPNTIQSLYRQQIGTDNQLRGRDKQLINQRKGIDPEGDG